MSAVSISPRELFEILGFVWQAGRGYRLRPWRSPYLRWRIETYSGRKAEGVAAADFRRFLWSERRRLARYLRWTGAMRARQASGCKRTPTLR